MAFEDQNLILAQGFLAFFMAFLLVFLVIMAAVYVYTSLALMFIAKRTKTEPAWLAWVPIGNLVLMSRIAKMHWWPVLLIIGAFIPFIDFFAMIALFVFAIIWTWKICEARNRPGWWAILQIIPFVGFIWSLVMMGILAWSKD